MMEKRWVEPGKYWITFSQPKLKTSPTMIDFFRKAPIKVKNAV
jgi:hypothetical protein